MNPLYTHHTATLDRYHDAALEGLVSSAVLATFQVAENLRQAHPQQWPSLVQDIVRPHPLFALYQQCPMTRRCAEKPRGYAGDAVMLDFIYDRQAQHETQAASPDGLEMFRTVASTPTCGSVDFRRRFLAKRIDAMAAARASQGLPPLRVQSLACGHARELELTQSLSNGQIGTVLALDQDPLSLATVRARFADLPVEAYAVSVRDILRGKAVVDLQDMPPFDLVYSAGLYDYLEQKVATRLTAKLFDLVAPGGELLLANFHPDNHGTGYMEAFMDWWLIYRTDEEMLNVTNEIAPSSISKIDQFRDPFGNVTYLAVARSKS